MIDTIVVILFIFKALRNKAETLSSKIKMVKTRRRIKSLLSKLNLFFVQKTKTSSPNTKRMTKIMERMIAVREKADLNKDKTFLLS